MALDFPNNPVDGQAYDNFYYDGSKGTWKSLSSGASPNYLVNPLITDAVITATATTASVVPITVKGAASQSANLQEWKNSSGINLTNIDSSGNVSSSGSYSSSAQNILSRFNATNTSSANDQFLYLMSGTNNTGTKAVHFINSSTRTTDGGANGYTIRNDGGPLNLGTSSQNTNINGFITMPNQPVYAGSFINYTSTTSNYFPATNDIFRIGFSKSGNNRLTAQVAGKYYVSAQQLVNTTGTSVYFQIMKNGAVVSYAYSNADDTYDVITSSLIDLQVNDYVEIFYAGTTTYSWPNPHSYYSVFKVS